MDLGTTIWIFELRHILGVVLSLSAAIFAALVNILVRIGTSEGNVYDTVFIVICINTILLFPIVLAIYYPNYGITRWSLGWFVSAGLVGMVLGRILRYTSIDIIGASRTTPIVASWVLIATTLGVVILGETVNLIHGVGILLVVGGVITIALETSKRNPTNLSRRELLVGLALPLAAAVALGFEPIFVNFGFSEGTPAPVGLLVRTGTGLFGVALYLWWRDTLPSRTVVSSAGMRWYVYAGITSTLAVLAYYIALEIAPVSIVTPIFATNTLFVVVLSAVIIPDHLEVVSQRLLVATTVVVSGTILITFYG